MEPHSSLHQEPIHTYFNFPDGERWEDFEEMKQTRGKYQQTLGGSIVYVVRPFVFAHCCIWKLGSYLPIETGSQGHWSNKAAPVIKKQQK